MMKMFIKLTAIFASAVILTAPVYAGCTASDPDSASMQGGWLAEAGPNTIHLLHLRKYSEVDEVVYFSTTEKTVSGEWSLSRRPVTEGLAVANFYLQIRRRSGHTNKNKILSFDCSQLMLQDQYGKVRTYYRYGEQIAATLPVPIKLDERNLPEGADRAAVNRSRSEPGLLPPVKDAAEDNNRR